MMEKNPLTVPQSLLEKAAVPLIPVPSPTKDRYATICVTINPSEVPTSFLRKVLSICASKLGSSNVRLASQVMIVLNVCFDRRAGPLTPEVLLIKDPMVLSSRAGEAKARDNR